MTGQERFSRLADRWLDKKDVEPSTMMGFPCLRVRGQFFASVDRAGEHIVIKLPAARVQDAVKRELGLPFAPNGRVFREWLAVPLAKHRSWGRWMTEAHDFVRENAA